MKRLLSYVLLFAVLLAGCNTASPEATIPSETVMPPVMSQPPETTPPETTPPDPLKLYLETLTLQQKVGQLFIVVLEQLRGGSGAVTQVTEELKAGLQQYPVGGVILFVENVISPTQLHALNQQLQTASPIPLFISTDEEGGRVVRLAKREAFNLPKYKSAASVAASGGEEAVRDMGRTMGAYLKEYGVNLDFAPVADVNTNPQNTIIGNRAFSSDPVVAAAMAAAFADGLREHGVIATFKHFPGHGDTAEDSHTGLAVNHKNRQALENCEWLPFLQAKSTDMVMVGHIALPEVTGNMTPATMSKEIVTELLKKELGFSGLVITDALNMGAITKEYSAGEAAVGALQAGCDILLMPDDLEEAFAAVLEALENGTLSTQWLDEAVYRILQFKIEHGILTI